MTNNICDAASTFPKKKIAVISGIDHHSTLLPLLMGCKTAQVMPNDFLQTSKKMGAYK